MQYHTPLPPPLAKASGHGKLPPIAIAWHDRVARLRGTPSTELDTLSMTSASRSAPLSPMRTVARARLRLAAALTAIMVTVYFGFLALVAWAPHTLATLVRPGLSLGVLLGALVIVCAWVLTFVYVRWANAVYDPMVAAERDSAERDTAAAASFTGSAP